MKMFMFLFTTLVLSCAECSTFVVTDFGAVGDARTDDSASISRALAAAANAPPSVVVFPAGLIFLSGPLNLSNSMTLQVDGTLRAISGNNTDTGLAYIRDGGWPQIPPLPSYGDSRDGPYLQYQAFLYATGVTDVVINGSGTIDGQGDWWWANQRNRSVVRAGRPNLVQFVNVSLATLTQRNPVATYLA